MLLLCYILFLFPSIYWLWTRNYNYWKIRGITGPEPNLIYGNTKSVFMSSKSYCAELGEIYKSYSNSGHPVVGYFAGRKPHLLVTDAYTTKEILVKSFSHFNNNEVGDMMTIASDPIISRNPFFQHENWKRIRMELVPAFTTNRVKAFYPIIKSVCEKFRNYVKENCESSLEMDIDDLTGRFTADVTSDVIFGVNANALTGNGDSLVMNMGTEFIHNFQKIGKFFSWNGILPLFKRFYKYQILDDRSSKFFQGLVQGSIDYREKEGGKRTDFLQFLVNLKEKKGCSLSLSQMTAHAMVFFLDGYDTSGLVMARILQELARHECVQDKLRAEINKAVKDSRGEIAFEEMSGLEYLNAVINGILFPTYSETLRLHPPIAMMFKQCTKAFQLNHPNYADPIEIPLGTPVAIHVAATHRDERYFDNPLEFFPERFIFEDSKKMNEAGMFLGFGAGPRICLGMKFAMAQIKAGVCLLIQNFTLTEDAERVSRIPIQNGNFLDFPTKKIFLNVVPIEQ